MTLGAAIDLWSNFPILGPYAIAVTNLTTASAQVVAADPTRKGIMFHNPGSKNKRVMPSGSALVGGTGGILIYPQSEFALMQTETSQFNINKAWIAVTDDNTDGTLTVLDFTPSTPNAAEVRPTTRLLQQNQIDSPVGVPTVNLGTGSIQVLAADPNRTGVIFHNPGTVVCAICPSNLAAAIGAGSVVLLPGETKSIVGNDRVRVNCAWNAIAQSGGGNAITALSLYG